MVVAVLWGLAFVATRIGLDELSPPQLAAARFLVAAAPVLVVARPRAPWTALVAVGLTLFAGQFLFQFFGIAAGMPPGLASIVVQSQAFFTIVLAVAFVGERPGRRQAVGVLIGAAGLGAIALTVGGDLSVAGLVLTLVAWLSLVPPVPALLVALALDGPAGIATSLASVSWRGIAAVLYLGVVATVLSYAIWGDLLRRYPTAAVTPFALLVPFVAAASSALVFGERFGPLRLTGMALVVVGLVVVVRAPARWAAAS